MWWGEAGFGATTTEPADGWRWQRLETVWARLFHVWQKTGLNRELWEAMVVKATIVPYAPSSWGSSFSFPSRAFCCR